MAPRISVLMSVYNGQRHLRESIDCILQQTFGDFEFIIVDDGSTDESWKILQEYAAREPRIVLVRNERNLGLIGSLNKGVALAKGEFIARQDDDDTSDLRRFEFQVNFLDAHPEVGALGTGYQFVDFDGNVIVTVHPPSSHEALMAKLLINNTLCHSSMMIRTNCLREIGGYDPQFVHAEDLDCWWRLGRISQISALPEVLVQARRGDNVTEIFRNEMDECAYRISLRNARQICGLADSGFPEEAYHRLWWTKYGKFSLQKGDIARLQPFWKAVSNIPGTEEWILLLKDLMYDLTASHRYGQAIEVLRTLLREFKLSLPVGMLAQALFHSGLPRFFWVPWMLKLKQKRRERNSNA